MTVNDMLSLIAKTVWDLLNPDTWRIVLLLLVAWGVLLLAQIRRLLKQFVEEVQFRSSFPQRGEPAPLDDVSLS
jgi:hypothetical protein